MLTLLQDSQIVQIMCKELKQQKRLVKELEEKNFFLADPGVQLQCNVTVSIFLKIIFLSDQAL